ncbi:Uncharacterised protein [Achromobacter xylosoxidans]|uniref:hypothetical protein n=1 Tax=Alcaligenes xylosoxydans xylosoxydans TaxID=85698 RepID=UPI0006C3272C|nr:hypothetical protein [Achromobacter xylosoxidans]CUK19274.1 Uncharacterised protein [Achromobacter xylosoxidans]
MTIPTTQPGAAPATGNTEKEQEMYAAGLEMGEANAKNNAAIRAATGWLPIESAPKDGTEFQAWLNIGLWEPRCRFNPDSEAFEIWGRVDYDRDDWDACGHLTATHWMPRPAAPGAAPGVSTVEDKPAAYLTLDEDGSPCMLFFDVVEARAYCEVGEEPEALWRHLASTAGDAQDAARYRSFRKALTRMDATWLDRVGAALEALGLNPDDDVLPTAEQVDAAFDAARAEQGERNA